MLTGRVRAIYKLDMVDAPDRLVLRYLRRIDEKLDGLTDTVSDLVLRVSAVERDVAALKVDFAGMQARLDGFGRRLDRIETRLALAAV